MRYQTNAIAWWLHDTVAHPLTGGLGLLGRIARSPRLVALSHQIHNASAPSHDAWGDWAEAAYRAACNEDSGADQTWLCLICGKRVPNPRLQPGYDFGATTWLWPKHKFGHVVCPQSRKPYINRVDEADPLKLKTEIINSVIDVVLSDEFVSRLADAVAKAAHTKGPDHGK